MIEQVVLTGVGEDGRSVECFIAAPARCHAAAALLFVHGHQHPARVGGADMVDSGALAAYADRFGIVAVAVSQPGYGGRTGPPDFCGPASQAAVEAVLGYMRHLPQVDPNRLILYGTSRGAKIAAMVAARLPDLRGVILVAGVYDLATFYPLVADQPIGDNIRREAGDHDAAFAERSALHHADGITAETVILHGRDDHPEQAESLAQTLCRNRTPVTLCILPCGHVIPHPERRRVIDPILRRMVLARSVRPIGTCPG